MDNIIEIVKCIYPPIINKKIASNNDEAIINILKNQAKVQKGKANFDKLKETDENDLKINIKTYTVANVVAKDINKSLYEPIYDRLELSYHKINYDDKAGINALNIIENVNKKNNLISDVSNILIFFYFISVILIIIGLLKMPVGLFFIIGGIILSFCTFKITFKIND